MEYIAGDHVIFLHWFLWIHLGGELARGKGLKVPYQVCFWVFFVKIVINAHPSVATPIEEMLSKEGGFKIAKMWRDKASLIQQMTNATVLVSEFASREVIQAGAPTLRFIQSVYRGVNGVDLNTAQEQGVIVSHTASNLVATAEHCFGLLLACAKKIAVADRFLRRDSWAFGYWSKEFSVLLQGKTLAIIGLGSIGRALAKRALAFEMKVIGVRRTGDPVEGVTVYKMDKLHEVLAQADFIAITLPLTRDTAGIIGEMEFKAMKPTAILVNTSRGKIIQQEALYDALKTRTIAGAGIDVWYRYPQLATAYDREDNPPGDFPFKELDNIVMTPHRGGFVEEAERIGINQVVENILRFSRGQHLLRIVDLDAGY